MLKGDIVLITFPFSDLCGEKLRPAVVLFQSRLDVTVCFITTKMHWMEPSDILIKPSVSSGIQKESLIRLSKIATLDKSLAIGLLGQISSNEMVEMNLKLRELFKLI
jgi:mRNA interferase MazF